MRIKRIAVPLAEVVALLLFLLAPAALAAERVALVVGNAAYEQDDARLKNPVNDAAAVAAALRRMGFEVIEGRDLDRNGFFDKIIAFDDAAREAEIALFFYAGHGLQVDGRNYLGPVDLKLERKQDLSRRAIELGEVMEVMRSETNLVILDACRNNPLAAELARSLGLSRAVAADRGLARVEKKRAMLIAFATAADDVADDGEGDHSPYTAALLEHLETPGLSVQDLFTQVTATVLAGTGERQKPWTHSSLSKIVRLVPGGDSEATATAPAPAPASESVSGRLIAEQLAAQRLAAERELLYWESVKDSTNPADIQAYLDRYPDGVYAALGHNRLQALQGAAAPAAAEETAKSVEDTLGLRIPERRLIQMGLLAEGHDLGKADGLIGKRTRVALKQWQSSRGEAATGYLDVESGKLLLAAGERYEAQDKARQAAAAERLRGEQEARGKARREAEARRLAEEGRRQQEWGKLGLVLVRVEGGGFIMGCQSRRDGDCLGDGEPAHRVKVPSFEIGKYEVTQALWEAVMGENPSSFKSCPQCPVVGISWHDTQEFLAKLNAQTEGGYRLPTAAEWEYAARGGRHSRGYAYAGGNKGGSVGWHGDNSGGRTHPVGQKRANELGLFDMSGNVGEWVEDCWNDSYRGAPVDGRAWEQGDCSVRAGRGGSWALPRWATKLFVRSARDIGGRSDDRGFRITRTLTP